MNRLITLILAALLATSAAAQSQQWTAWGGTPPNSGGGNDVIYGDDPFWLYWLRHGFSVVTGATKPTGGK